MSIKDSQSLSQETGIHEAFLTRVGITTKGQSSLFPPQPEKESSRGTRELCWCKGRINQDLEYSLETSSPIWMLQQLCSPWVWPQRVHRKSPTWGKKRKERRRRMHEALESRQRLDFFSQQLTCVTLGKSHILWLSFLVKIIYHSLMCNRHWIINTSEVVSNILGVCKRSHVNIRETEKWLFSPSFLLLIQTDFLFRRIL